MEKYILVYEIDNYADCGGGIQVEFFDSELELISYINNELKAENIIDKKDFGECEDKVAIVFAGEIKKEFVIQPVSKVTRYEIKN